MTRTPHELKAVLDRHVEGQEAAKIALSSACYYHTLQVARSKLGDKRNRRPTTVLLVGPTGSGKTLLLRTLATAAKLRSHMINAAQLTQEGYQGASVGDVMRGVTAGDVVMFDEIDKKARRADEGRDVAGEGVQQSILKLIEGDVARVGTSMLDTSNVFYVLAGRFEGLHEIIARRTGLAGADEAELLPLVSADDLVEFGLLRELVGRMTVIVPVLPLKAEDLVEILENKEGSILRYLTELFELHGVELIVTRGARLALARNALGRGTGARALDECCRTALRQALFDLPELARRGITRVLITAAVVKGLAPPLLDHADDPPSDVASAMLDQAVSAKRHTQRMPPAFASPTLSRPTRLRSLVANLIRLNEKGRDYGEAWIALKRRLKPQVVLWVLETLRHASATPDEYIEACDETGITPSAEAEAQAVLLFLRYKKLVAREREQRHRSPSD